MIDEFERIRTRAEMAEQQAENILRHYIDDPSDARLIVEQIVMAATCRARMQEMQVKAKEDRTDD